MGDWKEELEPPLDDEKAPAPVAGKETLEELDNELELDTTTSLEQGVEDETETPAVVVGKEEVVERRGLTHVNVS